MDFDITTEHARNRCITYIQKMPLSVYNVILKEIRRSNPQNRLYWQWVGIIGKHVGHNKDDLHDAFKRNFIGEYSYTDVFGRVVIKAKSSKKLKKAEFSEFMNKVFIYASGEKITLPSTKDFGYE